MAELAQFVAATAERFGIPGVAVGVWTGAEEAYACHGVTSVENPLPIDPDTLFVIGSVTKSMTATMLMRLVSEGRVELDAPVRRYVPELVLADERTAAEVTVRHLLNHTSGLGWNVIADVGDGDDALARFVAAMAGLEQVAPLGARASYSQAGYNLIGRVIEKVGGQTYEQAVSSQVLDPAGLTNSFYLAGEVMTRRFTVGHNLGDDGPKVARPWKHTRGNNPGGGLASSITDQVRWARFQLGDGAGVLPSAALRSMREPTVKLRSSKLGDAIGLCWFLRDVDGVRTVGHGGSANGQFAEFLMVPERNFAVVAMANAGPDGIPFNQAILRWALENYLGIVDRDPEPVPYDDARAREVVGTYDIDAMTLTVATTGSQLVLECRIKPEIRAASAVALPADHAPFDLGFLPGEADEYILTSGAFEGQRGYFTRDNAGVVVGVDLAGRMFTRV